KIDPATGIESAPADPNFNPTSDNGTGIAFATLDSQFRNTESGKTGIFCAICHTNSATRDTPFHNYERGGAEYFPAVGTEARDDLEHVSKQELLKVAHNANRNLAYSTAAGAYRLSPHAIVAGERFGPLAANTPPSPLDSNTSTVFGMDVAYQHMDPSKHK